MIARDDPTAPGAAAADASPDPRGPRASARGARARTARGRRASGSAPRRAGARRTSGIASRVAAFDTPILSQARISSSSSTRRIVVGQHAPGRRPGDDARGARCAEDLVGDHEHRLGEVQRGVLVAGPDREHELAARELGAREAGPLAPEEDRDLGHARGGDDVGRGLRRRARRNAVTRARRRADHVRRSLERLVERPDDPRACGGRRAHSSPSRGTPDRRSAAGSRGRAARARSS